MSANWKAGDKAVCIKEPAGLWLTGQTPPIETFPNGLPKRGEIYLVSGVNCWNGRTCLTLTDKPTVGVDGVDEGWAEYLFRKIVPASERIHVTKEAKA